MNVSYGNTLSVSDYCRLRSSVEFYDISEDLVRYALDKSDFIVAASVDDIAVGMARLISDGTQALVMDVVVHPDHQGLGIGRGLMERIREHILRSEHNQILVNLFTDSTKAGFYEKLGYHKAEGMRLWLEGP